MSATNNKFSTTVCSAAAARKFRADIGPIESQFEAVQATTKDLKRVHQHQQAQAQHRSKEDHTDMLLMLLAEARHYHQFHTQRHVCKINRVECAPTASLPAGLSQQTMKALVTDIDIVMTDADKDNYQHALTAIAALSLWH